MPEPPDPIMIQVTVPLPIAMVYTAFIEPEKISGWMAEAAVVEPRVGGRYEITVTQGEPFASHGKVTMLTQDVDIGFSWEAPSQFASIMNLPHLKTSVYLRLQESPEGIDVTLEHSGWEGGDDWEDARSWHFHFWDDRLHRLRDFMLKAAYG
ncbi:MAG: SRPBCC domain-containing protein [Thermoplasmata archaeon]|nr:SRPBCC domain-containing protein [Thermoplasmata archaeon]